VSRAAHEDVHADLLGGWVDVAEFDADTIRRIPLFADLEQDALELVIALASELRVAAGETVIQQWQGTRHFYAILEGEIEIRTDSGVAGRAGAGEFFGELAALDWGAGFGYARTATVVASSPTRLIVLTPSAFGELVRRVPSVEGRIREVARERLRQV
jgi:CRP-like cAMP-binding protein